MTSWRSLLSVALLVMAWTARANAQDAALHLVWRGEGGRSETWSGRVATRLSDEGLDVRRDDGWSRTGGPDLTEAHAALVRVESALASARAAMRTFDERGALATLASARDDATRSLTLPGTVAWAAEVELAIGRIAAQAGLRELARASFARAFAIAPTRALGAAEAAPDVVALASEVMTSVRGRPAGRFDVRVTWDQPAQVFLDDQTIGRAPQRIETRAGTHVLRVEAEGAEPYVAWIDVLPGTRPALDVTLSPTPLAGAVRSAHEAVVSGGLDALPMRVRAIDEALGAHVVVWFVEAGTESFDRAIATACDAERCHVPVRLDAATREAPSTALEAAAFTSADRRRALAWRDEPEPLDPIVPPPTDPWSEAWPWALVGTGAALVIGGVITGIVIATQPPPEIRFELDPNGRRLP